MLNALKAYRDQGGTLVYLGGNGFYWKVALDPTREGIIEVRRAEGGIRAWAAEPGSISISLMANTVGSGVVTRDLRSNSLASALRRRATSLARTIESGKKFAKIRA